MNGLLIQAVLAFLAMPGLVAFLIPWFLLQSRGSPRLLDRLGLIPSSLGVALLLWCVVAFYAAGKGTLAPWAPPRYLVVTGPYRVSRNPMYVAVLLILGGWALGYHSGLIAVYALIVALAFQMRVVLGEEPWLASEHGDAWVGYKAHVPRWFGFRHGIDSTRRVG